MYVRYTVAKIDCLSGHQTKLIYISNKNGDMTYISLIDKIDTADRNFTKFGEHNVKLTMFFLLPEMQFQMEW